MGQAAGKNSSLKETQILNMKQKEIMQDFREGRCNLLVSTSVLVISNLGLFFIKDTKICNQIFFVGRRN
jgi:hypothetical protein